MKKIIKLTESDLERIIKRVISEQKTFGSTLTDTIFGLDKNDDRKKVAVDIDRILMDGKVLRKNSSYDKDSETLQRALVILGYELPKSGVDGKFGKETEKSVMSFQDDNDLEVDGVAGELTLTKISDVLRNKKSSPQKTEVPTVNKPQKQSSSGAWEQIAFNYIADKEKFKEHAKKDQDKYRAGYGTSKILRNGTLIDVQKDTVVTKEEAVNTLKNHSIPSFSRQIIKDLGSDNWDKLNDNQKAALVSVAYNVGPYFLRLNFGKEIIKHITNGDLEAAGRTIFEKGPKTGKVTGYMRGLEIRRKEESDMFLS